MTNESDTAYGGFWIRFLAYLVDTVILTCVLLLIAFLGAFLGPAGSLLIGVGWLLLPLLYWGLMHASKRQASLGKALLGLKVTGLDGGRISVARSLGRELAKYVSAIPMMIGFIVAAFTGRKQALHDLIASTIVVKEGRGHLVPALLIGVFGWLAPAGIVMAVGAGLFAGSIMELLGGGAVQQAAPPPSQRQVVRTAPRKVPPPAPRAAPKAETKKVIAIKPPEVARTPAAPTAMASAAKRMPAVSATTKTTPKTAMKTEPAVEPARSVQTAPRPAVSIDTPRAKPVQPAARKRPADDDARKCLDNANSIAVIRCAEAYR